MKTTQFLTLALLVLAFAEVSPKTLSPPVIINDVNAPDYIMKKFGSKVIQSDENKYDRIKSCGKDNAPDNSHCFYFSLEPTSNDHDAKPFKSRLELNIPLSSGSQLRTSQQGQTYNTQWYFYVDAKNVITNGFFNIHQVFGEGFGPLICHSLDTEKFIVKHSITLGDHEVASTSAKSMMGKWVLVNETAHFESKEKGGWYQVSFTDFATGKVLLDVSRKPLDMWGKSTSVHTKFGIYRRKGDKHYGSWPTSHVAFSDFKITKL